MSPMGPTTPAADLPSDDVVMAKNRNRAGSAGSFIRGMIQSNLGGEAVAPVEPSTTTAASSSFPAKFANKVALTSSNGRLKANSFDSDGIEDDRLTASTRPESSAWGGSVRRNRTASANLRNQSSAGASGFVKGIFSRVTSGMPSSSGEGSGSSSAGAGGSGRQQYSAAAERALSNDGDDDDEEEDHLLDRHRYSEHGNGGMAVEMEEEEYNDDYGPENLDYATSSTREMNTPWSRPGGQGQQAFGYGGVGSDGGGGRGGGFEDFKPIMGNDGTLNMPGAASPPPFGHPAWAMQQGRHGSNMLSAATLSAEERIWVGIEGLLADAFSTSGGSRRTLTTDFGEYDEEEDDYEEDDLYRKDPPDMQTSIHIDTSRVDLEPPDVLRQLSREVQERNFFWQQEQLQGMPQAGAGHSAPRRNHGENDGGEDASRTDELLHHMNQKRDGNNNNKRRNNSRSNRGNEDNEGDDNDDWNDESTTASSASSDDMDDELDEIEMAQVALDSFMEFLLPELAERSKGDGGGGKGTQEEGASGGAGGGKRDLLRRQLEALSARKVSDTGEIVVDSTTRKKNNKKQRRKDASASQPSDEGHSDDEEDDSVDDAELAHTALNSFMDVLLSGVEPPPEQVAAAAAAATGAVAAQKRYTANTSSTIQSSSTSCSSSVTTSANSSTMSSQHKQRRSSLLSIESPTLESKKSLLTGDRLTLFELFRWSLRVNVDEQFAGNTKQKLVEALNATGKKSKKNNSGEDPHQTPVAGPKTNVSTMLRGDERGAEIEPYKPQEEENDHGDDENEKQNSPRTGIAAPPLLSGQEGEMGHTPAVGGGGDPSGMSFFSSFPLTDAAGANSTEELTSFFQEPQPSPPDPQQDDGGGNSMEQQQRPPPAPDRQQQMQVAATFTSTRRNDLRRAMSNLETIYDEDDEHEDTEEDDDDEKKLSPEEKNAKKKRRSLPTDITGTGDVGAVDKTDYKDGPLAVAGASLAAPSDEGSRAFGSGAHATSGRNHKQHYEDDEVMEEEDDIRKVIRDLKEIGAMFGIDKMELESTTMSDLSAEDAAAAVKDFASHPEKLQRYKQEIVARRASIEEPKDRRRLTSYRQPRDSQELALLQAAGITPREESAENYFGEGHDHLRSGLRVDEEDVIGRKRTTSDEASFTRFLEVVQSIYTGKNLDEDDLLGAEFQGKQGSSTKRRGEEKAEETLPDTADNAPLTSTAGATLSRSVAEDGDQFQDVSSTLRPPGSVRTLPRPAGTEAPPNEEAKILMSERLHKSSLDSAAAATYSGWRHSLVLSSLTQSGGDEVASSYAGPMHHSTSNPRFSQQSSQQRLTISGSGVGSLAPSQPEVESGTQLPSSATSPAPGKLDSLEAQAAPPPAPAQSKDVVPDSGTSETKRSKQKMGDSSKSLSPTPSVSSLRQRRSKGKLKPYNNSNREGDTSTPTSQDSQPPRILPNVNMENSPPTDEPGLQQQGQQHEPQGNSNRNSTTTVTSFFGTEDGDVVEFDNSWFEKNFRESVSSSTPAPAPAQTRAPGATKEAAAEAIAEARQQGFHSSIQSYDSGYFDRFASNSKGPPKRESTSSTAFTSQGSSNSGDDNNVNFMPTVSLPPIQEVIPPQDDFAEIQAEARHRDAQREKLKKNNRKKKSIIASFREGWCRCVVNPLFRRSRGPLEDDDDSVALAAKAAGATAADGNRHSHRKLADQAYSRQELLAMDAGGGGYDRNDINDLYLTSSSAMDQGTFRPLGLHR